MYENEDLYRRERGKWLYLGGIIGFMAGGAVGTVLLAWSTFFVDERITSALILGALAGAVGCYMYFHGTMATHKELEKSRNEVAHLRRALDEARRPD